MNISVSFEIIFIYVGTGKKYKNDNHYLCYFIKRERTRGYGADMHRQKKVTIDK